MAGPVTSLLMHGNPYHARCCASVTSIVLLKNNTDSLLDKPHILMSCGQEGNCAPSDKSQLTDCSGAHLSEKLIHLLCRLAVGDAHLCPRMTSEREETKDHAGLQLPLQTLPQWKGHKCSHAWWVVSRGVVYVQLWETLIGDSLSLSSVPTHGLDQGRLIDIWA